MAPPTPVFDRRDILEDFSTILDNPSKYSCQLKSLTQHECTFKVTKKNEPPEIICLPFKRLFQRCLIDTVKYELGSKIHEKKWINLEVTDETVNRNSLETKALKSEIEEFLSAERSLKKLMLEETEKTL